MTDRYMGSSLGPDEPVLLPLAPPTTPR